MAILINTQSTPYPSMEMLYSMLNAALVTVAKNWGQLNCPLTDERIIKKIGIYTKWNTRQF